MFKIGTIVDFISCGVCVCVGVCLRVRISKGIGYFHIIRVIHGCVCIHTHTHARAKTEYMTSLAGALRPSDCPCVCVHASLTHLGALIQT